MEDYLSSKLLSSNRKTLVYDENCNQGKHIQDLKKYNHVSVPQKELEQVFGEFGNMMIVFKKDNNYQSQSYPD